MRIGKWWKMCMLKLHFEIFQPHPLSIKRMSSVVEEHVHDDGCSPNINCFCIRGTIKYLGRHIKKSAALSLDVGRIVQFELGGESEIHNFTRGKIVVILKEDVFCLITEILAWLEISVDDVEAMQVADALKQMPYELRNFSIGKGTPFCFSLLHQFFQSSSSDEFHSNQKILLCFFEGVELDDIPMLQRG
jgi:hypothetical protein